MAQADDSAPRKTTTYKRFEGMASQNERYNTKPDEMFWLENIMRVSPKRLHSVPGPTFIQTYPISANCPNSAPGPQKLATVCCFDTTSGWSGASSTSGSLNYVDPSDYSWWATSGSASGFPSGPYPDGATIKWKLWANAPSCSVIDVSSTDAVPLTGHTANIDSSQSAQAGRNGHSDEKSYMLTLSSVSPAFVGGFGNVCYFGETSGSVPTLIFDNCGVRQAWTKYGSQIFQIDQCSASNILRLERWPIPFANNHNDLTNNIQHGGVPDPGSPVPGMTTVDSFRDMFANANYLYILARGSEFANPKICQVDKATLNFIQSWDIINSNFTSTAVSIYVFSDSLIFLLGWNGSITWTIGQVVISGTSAVTTVIDIVHSNCTKDSSFHASNTVGFQYAKNYFYINNDGGNVLQVGPLVCPANPDIPWES